jgi:hypothetical protein
MLNSTRDAAYVIAVKQSVPQIDHAPTLKKFEVRALIRGEQGFRPFHRCLTSVPPAYLLGARWSCQWRRPR